MDFLTYCKAHGILIDHIPQIGIWKRYPTVDKPSHKNGAVKFLGAHGFVQNHATDTEVSIWRPESTAGYDHAQIMRDVREAEHRKRQDQMAAANKAAYILHQCRFSTHPYLEKKGFKDDETNVWLKDGKKIMVIPMRVDGHLVGCQTINEDFSKRFLFGQRTSGASFVFDNKGADILCEGYATALSIRLALKNMKRRYCIHVCFSAGNMVKVAASLSSGYIVADHDHSGTGERVAKEIGWPYWMPPEVGFDANDWHQKVGIFKLSQALLKVLRQP